MFNISNSQNGRIRNIIALAFGTSLIAAGTAQAAGTRSLVIHGYDQSIAAVGRGLDPSIFHYSPNPYERNSNIEYYSSLIAQSRRTPMPQRISGTCAEACTMRLAIRGACVDRNAELWFLPALSGTGYIHPARTRAMFSVLPGAIGRWAEQNTNSNIVYDPLRANASITNMGSNASIANGGSNASIANVGYSIGNSYGTGRGPHFAVLTGAQAIALGAPACR